MSDEKIVKRTFYLTREEYDALERLRQLSGKPTIEATIRAAMKLFSGESGPDESEFDSAPPAP